MTDFAPLAGLAGGALIGLGAVILMATLGRIAGVCGILANALVAPAEGGRAWRIAFVIGLPAGALIVTTLGFKDWSDVTVPAALPVTIIAGLIVGIGTTYGSGCTSGHGVCGLSRFSTRSIVATLTFMATAGITVFVTRHLI